MARVPTLGGPQRSLEPLPAAFQDLGRAGRDADAFGAAQGRALVEAGRGIEAFAGIAEQRLRERQEADDASFIIAFEAHERLNEQRALTEAIDTAEGPANGLFANATSAWNASAADRLEAFTEESGFTPSPRALERARNIQLQHAGSLGVRALQAEREAAQAYYSANLLTNLQGLATSIVSDPGGYQDALVSGQRMIDEASAFLPSTALAGQRAAWANQAAWAWAQGMIVGGRADEVLRGTGLGAATPRPVERPEGAPTGPQSEASDALVTAMIQIESRGVPTAVSPAGATGLMQVMPGTAREVAQQLGEDEVAAMSDEDITRWLQDEENSVRYGTIYLNQMLRRYGGNVTLALAAYNAGPGRVDTWLRDNGDPRTGEISDAEWARRIPIAETRRYVPAVLGQLGAYPPTAATADIDQVPSPILTEERAATDRRGVDHEVLSSLTTQQMVQVHRAAEQAERERIAQLRADVQGELENELAHLGRGVMPPNPIPRDRIIEAFGPEDGMEVWGRLQEQRAVGAHIGEFALLPESEIAARRRSYTPVPGSDDFAAQVERQAQIEQAAEAVLAARREDPAQYVLQRSPRVQEAAEAIDPNDPATLREVMSRSLTVQAELEIPEHLRRPLTGEQASQFVLAWNDPENDAGQRVDMLAGITVALDDDRLGRQVIDQLVGAGIAGGNENIVYVAEVARDPGRRESAIRVLEALMVEEAPTLSTDLRQTLNEEFDEVWRGSVGQVLLHQGHLLADPTARNRSNRERALLMRMAELAAVGPYPSDPTEAAQKALTYLYGASQPYLEDDFAAIIVPPNTDQDELVIGLEIIRDNIPLTVEEVVNITGIDTRTFRGMTEPALQQLQENGVWVNHEDGFALVEPSTGSLVINPERDVWTISIEDALRIADERVTTLERIEGLMSRVGQATDTAVDALLEQLGQPSLAELRAASESDGE